MDNVKVEVQVTDKQDYNDLKRYADYFSDRTHVMSFSPTAYAQAEENYPATISKYVTEKEIERVLSSDESGESSSLQDFSNGKPYVYFDTETKHVYISKASIEMLCFLDIFVNMSPLKVSYDAYEKMFWLINEGYLGTSKNFDDAFSWIGYNSFISELNVYRAINPGKAFYGIPKWTMKELDKVKPIRIRGLNFPEANVVSAKFLPLKDMLVESVNVEERKVTFVKSNRPDGPKYIVTFYSFTRILKQCLTIGRIVNLAVQKVYGDDKNGFTMVQPVIVPKNVAFKELKGVKFRSRTIPARIYNLAWSEFNFRFGRKAAKNVDEEMEKDLSSEISYEDL